MHRVIELRSTQRETELKEVDQSTVTAAHFDTPLSLIIG